MAIFMQWEAMPEFPLEPVYGMLAQKLLIDEELVRKLSREITSVGKWIRRMQARQMAQITIRLGEGSLSESSARLLAWFLFGRAINVTLDSTDSQAESPYNKELADVHSSRRISTGEDGDW